MSSTPRREAEDGDMEIDEAPPPATLRSRSPLDEAISASRSATPSSVAELSRQFGQHTLQNHETPLRLDTSSSQPNPASTSQRRATTPRDHFSHVRQQRQTASRYQCSSSHRLRMAQLVERILQEEDAGTNSHYNLVNNANEGEATTSVADASISNIFTESYPGSSPPTLSPSGQDPESDQVILWRTSQQSAFGVPYLRSPDGAAPRRPNAVEKPIRMRRRAGGKGQRHKTS